MFSNSQAHDNKLPDKQPLPDVEASEQTQDVSPQSTVQQARTNLRSLTPGMVLQLQHTIGNKAVARRLTKGEENGSQGKQPVAREISQPLQMNTIQRDTAEDLREFANAGEQGQRAQMHQEPPPVMQVNNISDANTARSLMTDIEGLRPEMQDGGRTGTISGGEITANEVAIATLSDYLVTVGEQGRTLSTFQQQVQQVRLDFGRVSGQMIHFEAMGVVDPGQTSSYRAEQIVGAATGARSAQQSAAGLTGDASADRNHASDAHDRLQTKGNEVSLAQRDANQAVHGLNSGLSNLNSGIIPREQNPELATRQRDIKAKISTMQSRLAIGLQVIAAIGGAVGLSAAATTAATTASTGAYGSGVTSLGQQGLSALTPANISTAVSEEYYREETNQVQAQIDQANAQSREAAITANVSQVREAQSRLFSTLRTLEEKMTEYQQARDTLRTALANMGAAAERQGHGQGYTILGDLMGDVDVLVVQIDTTIGLGMTEGLAANQATEARTRVEGTRRAGSNERQGQISYYRPYQTFQLAGPGQSGGIVNKASPNTISFSTSERSPGSAYGGQGAANPVVQQTLEELHEMRNTVQGVRDVLARSLGLNMQR
ncbi:MAG: hypothetical protein IMZ62_15385 [Chloroflexi bacterium]|nr:hypothetical protein [Chloroflexota bacterium]